MGGLTLFSYGFRPFFLGVGLAAVVLVPLWAWSLATSTPLPLAWPPTLWHAHEMVFGFVAAAIAGFLLTAVPSWTGRRGFGGWPLLLLSGVWLAGRLAAGLSAWLPAGAVAGVTLAFLPVLAAFLAPPLLRERNRNTPLLLVLASLWGCQCLFHWAAAQGDYAIARRSALAAVDLVLLLITIVAGRITPSITATSLRQRGSRVVPRASGWVGPAAVTMMIVVTGVDIALPDTRWAGLAALLAGVVQAIRVAQWRPLHILRAPMVWVLHLAYAWLPVGLWLKAWSLLGGQAGGANWLHAFTVGAISIMIVAVMTRTALGYTRRPLEADGPTVVSFVLLALAALVRVAGPAVPGTSYVAVIVASAALWAVAFVAFLWAYVPILAGPVQRVEQRLG